MLTCLFLIKKINTVVRLEVRGNTLYEYELERKKMRKVWKLPDVVALERPVVTLKFLKRIEARTYHTGDLKAPASEQLFNYPMISSDSSYQNPHLRLELSAYSRGNGVGSCTGPSSDQKEYTHTVAPAGLATQI